MLSSCRDALLKLFKTTPPQKLFPSDCNTLYIERNPRMNNKGEGPNLHNLYWQSNISAIRPKQF